MVSFLGSLLARFSKIHAASFKWFFFFMSAARNLGQRFKYSSASAFVWASPKYYYFCCKWKSEGQVIEVMNLHFTSLADGLNLLTSCSRLSFAVTNSGALANVYLRSLKFVTTSCVVCAQPVSLRRNAQRENTLVSVTHASSLWCLTLNSFCFLPALFQFI